MSMSSQQGMRPASGSADGQPAASLALVASPGQSSSASLPVPDQAMASNVDNPVASGTVDCVFGCGPARPTSQMANTGTAIYPRWMCNPCNGARKAIEHQAKKDPLLKARLKDLKKMTRISGGKR